MPTLEYETDGTPHVGRLTGRALIGRRLSHGVVLSDVTVSRLHAWIDPTPDGAWTVADAGSKNGIAVNGQRVDRHPLVDGDVIRVGATRITFRAADDDASSNGAEVVALTPPAGESVRTSGVLFTCECGAPIWVGNDLVGKRGRCRHCKRQVIVPNPTTAEPAPATAPVAPGRRPQCGVCHSAIGGGEVLKVCPDCDTTFHEECWAENFGCSTYGCRQVDALNPNAAAAKQAPIVEPVAMRPAGPHAHAHPDAPIEGEYDEPDKPRMQWEWVTVLATLVASAAGALAFGVPALVMAAVAAVMLVRRRPDTRVGLLIAALAIALVGIFVGLAGSDFLYLDGRHLP